MVETNAHLHIPLASGNIMKVPLAAVQEEDDPINISTELTRTGMWQHIDSQAKLQPKVVRAYELLMRTNVPRGNAGRR